VQSPYDFPYHITGSVSINELSDSVGWQMDPAYYAAKLFHYLTDKRNIPTFPVLPQGLRARCISALAATGQRDQGVDEVLLIQTPLLVTRVVDADGQ
jgi:hypothetical protein